MKILLDWIRDYIDINLSSQEVAEQLTLHTAPAKLLEKYDFLDSKIVIGEIIKIELLEDSEHLKIATVDLGWKILRIVCGAPNIQEGQKVPVAQIKTILPNGMVIEERKIRGISSQGMLASEKELGLGLNHEGILILSEHYPLGQELRKILQSEQLLEIETPANRADLMGHYGVARELAAINQTLFKPLKINLIESYEKAASRLKVTINDFNNCNQYTARIIDQVVIKDSPPWLKNRLERLGQKSINNVVDITNYVMWELGQPLHAFDYNRLLKDKDNSTEIIVRQAKAGEQITTLDGQARELNNKILVISDSKRPIAIAGLMGGQNTEVDFQTSKIILESANFNPKIIRRGRRLLGLKTEASDRFEKGLSPNLTKPAIDRAAYLIKELTGGHIFQGIIEESDFKHSKKVLELRWSDLEKYLGRLITFNQTIKILENLDFNVLQLKDRLRLEVPLFRTDLENNVDVIEEIVRMAGYDKIPETLPKTVDFPGQKEKILELKDFLKKILVGLGFNEIYSIPFKEQVENESITITNPVGGYQGLRQELLSSLAEAALINITQKDILRLFEIGRIYYQVNDKPIEENFLAMLFYQVDFAQIKGELETLFDHLNLEFSLEKSEESSWKDCWTREFEHFYSLKAKGKNLGLIGIANSVFKQKFDLKHLTVFCTISLDQLDQFFPPEKKFIAFSSFPPVKIDLSFIVSTKIYLGEMIKVIKLIAPKLIQSVELFDHYVGKNIPSDQQSVAFRIIFQHQSRTLTDAEVMKIVKKIVSQLKNKFKVKLRGKV